MEEQPITPPQVEINQEDLVIHHLIQTTQYLKEIQVEQVLLAVMVDAVVGVAVVLEELEELEQLLQVLPPLVVLVALELKFLLQDHLRQRNQWEHLDLILEVDTSLVGGEVDIITQQLLHQMLLHLVVEVLVLLDQVQVMELLELIQQVGAPAVRALRVAQELQGVALVVPAS